MLRKSIGKWRRELYTEKVSQVVEIVNLVEKYINVVIKKVDHDKKMKSMVSADGVIDFEEMEIEESKLGNKHHLFENDDYEQSIIDSVWYNKMMPKRRVTGTRTGK